MLELDDPAERIRRLNARCPQLKAFAQGIRAAAASEVPDFDPMDGGLDARALFLLEAPGKQATGSGFISRENPDPTARAFREDLAPLPRDWTCLWNIVPWLITEADGTRIRKPSMEECARGAAWAVELIALMPRLRVIVLVGRSAWSQHSRLRLHCDLPMVLLAHPSPKVYNTNPAARTRNQALIGRVREMCKRR